MYDRILVHCTAKRGADAAVTHAIELAAAVDAHLTFLYLTQMDGSGEYRSSHVEEKVEGVGEEADVNDEIRALAKEAGVGFDVLIEQGGSGENISPVAERENTDVIVVGSVGKTTLKRILKGSIANDVVQSATLPVLTIRLNEEDIEGIGVYTCQNCRRGFKSTAEEVEQVQCPYCGSESLIDQTIR